MPLTTILSMALAASSIVTAAPASTGTPSTGAYDLIADYSGPGFFDHFTFYTEPDPTHGHVVYQDMESARQQQLIGYVYNSATNQSSAYVGVDHTNQASNGRNSVRLISKDTFNARSMVVIDTNHIPVGDGLWPAIWLLGTPPSGQEWPVSGESDILEYVHEANNNAMTLHTAPGCTVKDVAGSFQGKLDKSNCNAGHPIPGSEGCSIDALNQNTLAGTNTKIPTAGFAMNKEGGGVYVHDWQADGITVWMFPHGGLPADLVAGKPKPSTWKQKPLAKFQGDCDFTTAFKDMNAIINIDFCGDWAGQTWQTDGAQARVAHKTGVNYPTCAEYVAKNPQAFKDAYFDISSIKFYSNNGQKVSKRHEGPHATAPRPPFAAPPFPMVNDSQPRFSNFTGGMHNCSTTNNMTISRRGIDNVQTSDAESTDASGWFAAAGMFALVAWFL